MRQMAPEDVIVMDWLAENVCGAIPTLDELKDEAVEVTASLRHHAGRRLKSSGAAALTGCCPANVR